MTSEQIPIRKGNHFVVRKWDVIKMTRCKPVKQPGSSMEAMTFLKREGSVVRYRQILEVRNNQSQESLDVLSIRHMPRYSKNARFDWQDCREPRYAKGLPHLFRAHAQLLHDFDTVAQHGSRITIHAALHVPQGVSNTWRREPMVACETCLSL